MYKLYFPSNMAKRCDSCEDSSVDVLEHRVRGQASFEYVCASHLVEAKGEGRIEHELKFAAIANQYDIHPNVAREVIKRYPRLAGKHRDTLQKILKKQLN
jgi:hypothetical protein